MVGNGSAFVNAHMQQRNCCSTITTQQIVLTVTATIKDVQLEMVGAGLHASMHNAQQRTAVAPQLTQQIVYMITVQLQSKMHGWNEWLAYSALLSNAHAAAHRCSTTARSRLVHDNRTATIKDAQLE
jgi:hypothetical protein